MFRAEAPHYSDETNWSLPERQIRAVAEFVAGLDYEGPDANRKLPKLISPINPCSAWTTKACKCVQLSRDYRSENATSNELKTGLSI